MSNSLTAFQPVHWSKSVYFPETNRTYDEVQAETRKSQASFKII